MAIEPTLERFGELLHLRLERDIFTTEDSVRYTFFAALLEKGGLYPHDIVLEHRHPSIAGAEIDTWAPTFGGRGLAVEFKYDRGLPSGKNTPRTQKAGQVFHDLYRLRMVAPEMLRVFVYLTGVEMARYFSNPTNGLAEFFSPGRGRMLVVDSGFMSSKSPSFVASTGEVPNVLVTQLYSRSLPKDHELRVYEVRNAILSPSTAT
jgi:hypothetical protein